MDNLPINVMDLAVIGTIVACTLIGVWVGFVKGGLYVVSWLGAIAATYFGFLTAQPYARDLIDHELLADIAAGAALFLPTLIVLFLVSSIVESWVRRSRLSALDRSLGMAAGLATGVLLVCVVYSLVETTWSEAERPAWVGSAKSLPFVRAGADLLRVLLPANAASFAGNRRSEAEKLIDTERVLRGILSVEPATPENGQPPGYDAKERSEMQRLLDTRQ
ncbi:MAG TPA: CvpA family protein [Rhodospirillales bacterium]|nr:CvpA family protein [Rhodospirillales bacterium]HJO68127.1 CvpA family protein [Rhodospirillales bacterium]